MSTTFTTPNQMSDEEKEAILSRLMKLESLRKRSSNEAEAAVAAMRIKECLDKYNLDAGVLSQPEKQKGVEQKASGKFSNHLQPYDITMAYAVNKIMDTLCFQTWEGKKKVLCFVGLKANVEAAILTFQYFQETCDQMIDSRWLQGQIKGRHACQSFRIGFADSVIINCKKVYEQRMAELSNRQVEGGETTALVYIGQSVAKDYLAAKVLTKGHEQAPRKVASHFYSMGRTDGSKCDVMAAQTNRMIKR